MKTKISLVLVGILALTYVQAFAADVDTSTGTDGSGIPVDSGLNADSLGADIVPVDSANTDSGTNTDSGLNAATPLAVAPKGAIGNYGEIACDKDFFTQNACNQCFEGGKKLAGEKIAGLTDSWTNPNANEQVIYKDEQTLPEFINLGGAGTTWANNPVEVEKFWKYNDEIVWTDSATGLGKQEFLLEGGKTVNFLEADLGASYTLQASDKQEGDAIGLLKFNLNYHDTDETAKEGSLLTHTECVIYYAGAPAPVTTTPPVTPPEVTKVKTGPESLILIIIALILGFSFVKLRKKS